MALPTLTTSAATKIAQRGAIGNGNVTATGGANCSELGFVWDTSSHADPGNVAPASSGYAGTTALTGLSAGVVAFGSTSIISPATGMVGPLGLLSSNTAYFYRSYGKNSAGYAYGGEQTFTTLATYPGWEGFAGAETGSSSNGGVYNLSDGYVSGANVSVTQERVYSGAYAFKFTGNASLSEVSPTITAAVGEGFISDNYCLNSSRMYAVARIYFSVLAGTSTSRLFFVAPPGIGVPVYVLVAAGGNWGLRCFSSSGNNSVTTDISLTSHAIATGKWYTVYLSYVDTTGQAEAIIDDGVNQFTYRTTGSQGWSVGEVAVQNTADTGDVFYMDDLIAHSDTYYAAKVIARSGSTTTPTYNAWTKNGGTVISDVWDDTPLVTSTSASSSTAVAAQTIVTSSFSAQQDHHGIEVILPGDTILGARAITAGIQSSSSSSPSMRTRVGGIDTDGPSLVNGWGPNTTVGGHSAIVNSPTLANVNAMEGGMVKANDAVTTTVYDAWFVVAYIPVALGASSLLPRVVTI